MGIAPEGGEVGRGTRHIGGQFELESVGIDEVEGAAIAVIDLAMRDVVCRQALLEFLDLFIPMDFQGDVMDQAVARFEFGRSMLAKYSG